MEVIENVPVSKLELLDESAEVRNLLTMFYKIQERGQKIQDEAETGEALVAAGSWSTMVGATGTLILKGYLLWKL